MVTESEWKEFAAAARFAAAWLFPNPGYFPELCEQRPLHHWQAQDEYLWPAPLGALKEPGAHLFHVIALTPHRCLLDVAVLAPSRYAALSKTAISAAIRDADAVAKARFDARDVLARQPEEREAASQLRRIATAMCLAGKMRTDDLAFAGFRCLADMLQKLVASPRPHGGVVCLWPGASWNPEIGTVTLQFGQDSPSQDWFYRWHQLDIQKLTPWLRCHPPLWTAQGLWSAICRVTEVLREVEQ